MASLVFRFVTGMDTHHKGFSDHGRGVVEIPLLPERLREPSSPARERREGD
jgi:hypothetical protein